MYYIQEEQDHVSLHIRIKINDNQISSSKKINKNYYQSNQTKENNPQKPKLNTQCA